MKKTSSSHLPHEHLRKSQVTMNESSTHLPSELKEIEMEFFDHSHPSLMAPVLEVAPAELEVGTPDVFVIFDREELGVAVHRPTRPLTPGRPALGRAEGSLRSAR